MKLNFTKEVYLYSVVSSLVVREAYLFHKALFGKNGRNGYRSVVKWFDMEKWLPTVSHSLPWSTIRCHGRKNLQNFSHKLRAFLHKSLSELRQPNFRTPHHIAHFLLSTARGKKNRQKKSEKKDQTPHTLSVSTAISRRIILNFNVIKGFISMAVGGHLTGIHFIRTEPWSTIKVFIN